MFFRFVGELTNITKPTGALSVFHFKSIPAFFACEC